MKYWSTHEDMPEHIEKALQEQPLLQFKPDWVAYEFEPITPVIAELVNQIDAKDLLIFRVEPSLFNKKLKASLIHHPESQSPFPTIKPNHYCLQRVKKPLGAHYRVSFANKNKPHNSWLEHEYFTEDVQGQQQPIAYAPYTAHFSDGSKHSGFLDHKGFARHDDIAEGPVRIVYAKTLADSKLENSESLLKHLDESRQSLKNVLDRIIIRHQKRVAEQNALLQKRGFIGRNWMLTRAFLAGVIANIEQNSDAIIKTWIDLHRAENAIAHDILHSLEAGNLQPLHDQLSYYCQHYLQAVTSWEQATKRLVTLCSDEATRHMLIDFIKRYFQTESEQDLAHMAGSVSVQLLLMIVTDGETDLADASVDTVEANNARKIVKDIGIDPESQQAMDTANERAKAVEDAIERFHTWALRHANTARRIKTIRRDRIDAFSHRIYMQRIAEDLKNIQYVYRGVSREVYGYYEKAGKISDASGGNQVYFAIDHEGIMQQATPLRYKSLTQIEEPPDIILRVPISELTDIEIPRPEWNKQAYGYEYKINHFPKKGIGGLYQLFGKTNNLSTDWIIYSNQAN